MEFGLKWYNTDSLGRMLPLTGDLGDWASSLLVLELVLDLEDQVRGICLGLVTLVLILVFSICSFQIHYTCVWFNLSWLIMRLRRSRMNNTLLVIFVFLKHNGHFCVRRVEYAKDAIFSHGYLGV